jgi:3-oxoacyl-[acyl-carrier-protein] synthase II
MDAGRDVWVTGIGLLSSMGIGLEAHRRRLIDMDRISPDVDENRFAPCPVHPLAPIDFSQHIPSKSEQRQMGAWQRIGVCAAGLALETAGLAGRLEILDNTDLVVAAGNGERDESLDQRILTDWPTSQNAGRYLNEALATGLRPTLYLGELSNLLAGNIQIIHKVTGSSRTFKGEEMAGVSAIENAFRRIGSGQGEVFLVGGALNAEREDLLLNYELGCNLWPHAHAPIWEREPAGGGFVPGSVGAFLVLESRSHAEARGARPYARIGQVVSDHSRREPGDVQSTLTGLFAAALSGTAPGALAVLSGASGVEPATGEELEALLGLSDAGFQPSIRAYGSVLGHTVEAHFPLGVALAALSLSAGVFYPPFDATEVEQAWAGSPDRIAVTGVGHWRGEGVAVLERVGPGEAR